MKEAFRKMKNLGYYNGIIDEPEKIMIPMNDRACWFGDGVYDACLARNYKIFALEDHLNRLFRNAAWLELEPPMTRDELKNLLDDLMHKMDEGELFVYIQLTRATGPRKHIYTHGPSNLWITVKPLKFSDDVSLKVITCEDDRWMHNDVKSINLISAVRTSEKAHRAGCEEAILVRPGGIVTECSHSNVHILKNGTLITHPADNMILPGIARKHLLDMCQTLGIPVNERAFTLDELMDADEIIITSTSKLCLSVSEIDGKPVGLKDRDTFHRIREALVDEFLQETDK